MDSIFHCNTQITKSLFLRIYLGIQVHNKFLNSNKFLNTRFIHSSKSRIIDKSPTKKPSKPLNLNHKADYLK